MHDKLKLLLEQIKLPNNYWQYFKDGNLLKIISNTKKDTYIFIVQIEKILPVHVTNLFIKLLKEI